MSIVRFVALVALAVWIGGLIVLRAIAAPVLFATLAAHDPVQGRLIAGETFGGILRRFEHVAFVLGLLIVVALFVRAAMGPQPHRFRVQFVLLVAMISASLLDR